MRSLPPLHVLRAFEAAARYENFTRAADELCLTHSAVSRHIKSLEHWLGESLFLRSGPHLTLSDAGRRLQLQLSAPLQALHEVLLDKQYDEPAAQVQLHTLPSIANAWLLPGLAKLHTLAPQLRLTIVAGYDVMRLPPHTLSVALRHGVFDHDGLFTEKLLDERMVIAAAPNWFASHGEMPDKWPAEQLLVHTYTPWPRRLPDRAGEKSYSLVEPKGTHFNDALLLVNAAVQGLGVIWAREAMIQDQIAKGKLRKLAQFAQATHKAYWFACREEIADQAPIKSLLNWLRRSIQPDQENRIG